MQKPLYLPSFLLPGPATFSLAGAMFLLLSLIASPSGAVPHQTSTNPTEDLKAARTALAKYKDSNEAIQDFYISIGCLNYPMDGVQLKMLDNEDGVAVYLLNWHLLNDKDVDPEKPEMLIYEKTKSGSLKLAGAEWLVLSESTSTRPRLFSHRMEGPTGFHGRTPLGELDLEGYQLHAWFWINNPAGLFASANPNLTCPDDGYTIQATPP